MPVQFATNTIRVDVGASPLPDTVMAMMTAAYVDDSLNLPDMFALVFRDPDRTVLGVAGIRIGTEITISIASEGSPGGEKLIAGEVTALEAEFEPSGTLTVVRGFDKSHRLFRGRRTEAYRNATYADIARKVAARAGLGVGRIDACPPVHPQVTQGNVSDWQFLTGLARRSGFEFAVVDGRLDFRKPVPSGQGPRSGNLRSENPLQLTLGANLLRFRSVVTAAEQVGEVQVRGWDATTKKAVIGTAPAGTTSATLAVTPKSLATGFGNPRHVSVAAGVSTQSEAQTTADALAQEIGGSFATFDGTARGNPKLRAGTAVSLGLVGEPFDGRYTLTTTRHIYDAEEGYTTWFTVSGRQERSLLGLASGTGGSSAHPGDPVDGVVVGIVTNNQDPEKQCRVKVKFPWLSDDYESDWMRSVQAWVGNGYGCVVVPEVNDEVLVAFEHGDLAHPYVVGGLYNGKDRPKDDGPLVAGDGMVNRRALVTRVGHALSFVDQTGKESVRLTTGDGGYVLELGQSAKKVTVHSDGAVEISAAQDVTIKAGGSLELSGRSIALKAQSGVKVDGGGGAVEVKGGPKVSLDGATIAVNGSGTAELKAGGIVTIQGSLVKIN